MSLTSEDRTVAIPSDNRTINITPFESESRSVYVVFQNRKVRIVEARTTPEQRTVLVEYV